MGLKHPGNDVSHLPIFSAEAKKGWSFTSTRPPRLDMVRIADPSDPTLVIHESGFTPRTVCMIAEIQLYSTSSSIQPSTWINISVPSLKCSLKAVTSRLNSVYSILPSSANFTR